MGFRNLEGPAAIMADIAMAGMEDIPVVVTMAGTVVIEAAITATITTMMFFGE